MLLKCPACGAPLDYDGSSSVIRCKFCGNRSLVPGATPSAGSSTGLSSIRQLISDGNIDEAISQFSQMFHVDEAEARDAVQAIQDGWTATASTVNGRSHAELTAAMQKIQSLLAAGDKIEAIKVYRETFDVGLEPAKDAIDRIENGLSGGQVPPSLESTAKAGKGCSMVAIVIGIVILVGGVIAFLLLHNSGSLDKHYNPSGPAVFVPSTQPGGQALALSLYDPDSDTRFAGLVDPATGKLLWHGAAFKGDNVADAMAGTSDMLYAAADSDLLAYHSSDGSLAWQTVMSDKLSYGQKNLLVTGGRVITNNTDHSLQAYDANSGRLVWNRQMQENDSELRLIKNQLVEMDETDTVNNNMGLVFLDPVTGAVKNSITPTCNTGDMSYGLDSEGQIIDLPQENALLLIMSQGCIEKLDLGTMKMDWTAAAGDWFNPSMDNGLPYVLTAQVAYFGNGGDLMTVDLASGTLKTLVSSKSDDLVPLTLIDGTLIVRAKRTTGSERFALWGVDASSGATLWQMDEQDSQPIDPPDAMAGMIDKNDFGWTWAQSGSNLVLVTFKGEPDQAVIETFDVKSGASQGQKTVALNKVFGDFYSIPTVLARADNLLYVDADGAIYALDISAGTGKYIY